MRYRSFAPLGRDASLLSLGTLFLSTADLDAGCEVLDEWVALGGTLVDTAHDYGFAARYGYGDAERALGRWLERRPEVRDRLLIVSKGGHPNEHRSRVTPEDITSDLRDSLARLHGPIDLYLLHRDDPAVAVGPIMETLNAHLSAGSVRAIGASNWSPARYEEANEYAAARGLRGFSASSCHLSLATQNQPHWPGALSARDPETHAWHVRSQVTLLAWSAVARGYFADRDRAGDPVLRRVYENPANRGRLERAHALAERLGRTATEVALAWVLHQPFPVHAVVGPRSAEELHSCVAALDIELSEEVHRWLDAGQPPSQAQPASASRASSSESSSVRMTGQANRSASSR